MTEPRISVITMTGFANSKELLSYVHPWGNTFKNVGEIMFYGHAPSSNPPNIDKLTDVKIRGNDYHVCHYPHVDKNIYGYLYRAENKPKFFELMTRLKEKYPDKEVFTVNLEDFTEVSPEDFCSWTPGFLNKKTGHGVFIMQRATNPEVMFPVIFVIPWQDNPEMPTHLTVQSWASHWLAPVSNIETMMGKYMTYILINSQLNGEFTPHVPTLAGVELPKNPDVFGEGMHVEKLKKLIENSGVSNLKRVAGKTVDTNPPTPPLLPAPEEEDNIDHVFPFGVFSNEGLQDQIVADVINKGTVNFSSLIAYGVSKTIELVGDTEKPVEVVMDMQGFAKRMCIFQRMVEAVPVEGSLEALAEELGEFFVHAAPETISLVSHKSSYLN